MTDLERKLEELFMSDSQSRGVAQVHVPGPRRNRLAPYVFVGAVAFGALALVLAISAVRAAHETVPASSPSPTASAVVVAPASPATPSSPPSTSPSPGPSVLKPDASHGLITFEGIRTEAAVTNLQQPAQFSRTGATTFIVAVSPDGKRVAVVRRGEAPPAGQQLITFTTARPNQVTVLLDLTGSGETVGGLVWAGDNSDSLLLQVEQLSSPQPDAAVVYSSLRSIDAKTKVVKEIVRITTARLAALAWHPARNLAAAAEMVGGGAISYDLVRAGVIERTPFVVREITQLRASRDGSRILHPSTQTVRWWPVDQPAAARELAPAKGRVSYAMFRPGSDEIGVSVAAPTTPSADAVRSFEIWNVVTGAQRLVNPTVGFSTFVWRVDGSAAIWGTQLVDPDTGAATPLPGGDFKIADVAAF